MDYLWEVGGRPESHIRSTLVGLVLEEAPWSDDISASGKRMWTELKNRITISDHETQSSRKHRLTHNDVDTPTYRYKRLLGGQKPQNQATMEEKGAENRIAAMAASYQRFDPASYLKYNYTPPRADFERKDSIVPWKLACLHRAFTEGKELG